MKYIVREGIYTKVQKPTLKLRYILFVERAKAFRFNLYFAALTAMYFGWTGTWLIVERGIIH